MNPLKPTVALVDDHILLRNGLANLIRDFGDYTVLFEANNGKDFQASLKHFVEPAIVLLDINMPEMDGYETAAWIKQAHPDIKVLALSMDDKDGAIIRMLRNGARGYILKDTEPVELRRALSDVLSKGFYYSDIVTGKLIHNIRSANDTEGDPRHTAALSENELQFLKLACSEMTYKEIADTMHLSPRTIDGYRDSLFDRLAVRTRVGLAIYAIRNDIVRL
jgi:two-component system invasion response regulator UvrY